MVLDSDVYLDLAKYVYFGSNKTKEALDSKLAELDLQFRKNRGIGDINKAIQKSRDPKNGHYRVKLELDMLSVYLKTDIVKKKSKYKVGDKVKIVDYSPQGSAFTVCEYPLNSEMGRWLGQVMTITQVHERCYVMKEDKGRWTWTSMLIEKKEN